MVPKAATTHGANGMTDAAGRRQHARPTPLRHAPVPTSSVDTGACVWGKNASARSMNDVKTMFKRYKTMT